MKILNKKYGFHKYETCYVYIIPPCRLLDLKMFFLDCMVLLGIPNLAKYEQYITDGLNKQKAFRECQKDVQEKADNIWEQIFYNPHRLNRFTRRNLPIQVRYWYQQLFDCEKV